jgi:signal transduction histidine kinase
MDQIRQIFSLNRDIIYFAYGLVFFALGLAIALHSRAFSRLDLARSLKWLAAFGFAHGLHEWGDLFIPIQASYLSLAAISMLRFLHLTLLAVSFAFLFEFGVALLRPLGRLRWLHGVSAGLLAVWLLAVFFLTPALRPGSEAWFNLASALARYMIGFTGGILAAYGLRQHTLQRIAPLDVPHIVKGLQFAGLMLAFYAVFGGLIPPPVPYFPGSVINSETFEGVVGIPVIVFRSLFGLGLAVAVTRAMEVFDVETARMIEAVEQQQIRAVERSRLARDLHDGAIQKVYTAGLLVESAQKLAVPQNSELSTRLEKAGIVLNDAIGDLRRNLGELNTAHRDEPFQVALRSLAEDPRFRTLVDVSVELDLPPDEVLPPVRGEHVLSVVNEALSNAVRHARASQVKITGFYDAGRLKITVEDNGIGLSEDLQPGYGLRNMRDRARLLGGHIEISPANGRGTRVLLDIPWGDEHG